MGRPGSGAGWIRSEFVAAIGILAIGSVVVWRLVVPLFHTGPCRYNFDKIQAGMKVGDIRRVTGLGEPVGCPGWDPLLYGGDRHEWYCNETGERISVVTRDGRVISKQIQLYAGDPSKDYYSAYTRYSASGASASLSTQLYLDFRRVEKGMHFRTVRGIMHGEYKTKPSYYVWLSEDGREEVKIELTNLGTVYRKEYRVGELKDLADACYIEESIYRSLK